MSEIFTIKEAAIKEIAAGQYTATFQGLEREDEGKHGPYLTWNFLGEDGTIYKGFCNVPKGGPTPKNMMGKWLCGLLGKRPEAGLKVKPEVFIGQSYLLFYTPNDNGKVKLATFTKI